jgi:hypothetical protein
MAPSRAGSCFPVSSSSGFAARIEPREVQLKCATSDYLGWRFPSLLRCVSSAPPCPRNGSLAQE